MRPEAVQAIAIHFAGHYSWALCRPAEKDAVYFERAVDVLANPSQDVLIYDLESWKMWREVWSVFERDNVPRTDDMYIMHR